MPAHHTLPGLEAHGRTPELTVRTIQSLLGPSLVAPLHEAVAATAEVSGPVVNFAVAYSGRDEIVRAVDRLRHGLTAESGAISAPDIERHLDTAGQPDCDLVIRTVGETGLCGFMPWQSIYSRMPVSPKDWPDFTESDLARAVDSYHSRERRMGS